MSTVPGPTTSSAPPIPLGDLVLPRPRSHPRPPAPPPIDTHDLNIPAPPSTGSARMPMTAPLPPQYRNGHRGALASPANAPPSISTVEALAPTARVPHNNGASGHLDRLPQKKRKMLGEYILGKTIGAGSMGKVKLATHQATGEQVAIKIIPRVTETAPRTNYSSSSGMPKPAPAPADDAKEVRTVREAAMMTLIRHPFICGMKSVEAMSNHYYMVMEYVNGGQLLDYIISHGKLKEKQARKFARQIGSALDYLHKNSIVHRDLKIENILISKNGNIKLIDFGLSNLYSPKSHLSTFCGSLYFAAPELLNAKAYTGPEVDVWSFGIVMYVLVCGKVPFDDQSMPALHAKIKRGIVDYPNYLSPECKHLLSRMLVVDPLKRAPLSEIVSHPWMLRGYDAHMENYLPPRQPLTTQQLDPEVIKGMHGFEFGAEDEIERKLVDVLESEDYRNALKAYYQGAIPSPSLEKKKFSFGGFQRKSSNPSLSSPAGSPTTTGFPNLSDPSMPVLDPVHAFHPLISIYFLVRERQQRVQAHEEDRATGILQSPAVEMPIPQIPIPAEAHPNDMSYEIASPVKAAIGRSGSTSTPRARSRTHGEEEVANAMRNVTLQPPPALNFRPPPTTTNQTLLPPKEKSGGFGSGLLRRLSTKRGDKSKSTPPSPMVGVGYDHQASLPPLPVENIAPPRKSLSGRRSRDSDAARAMTEDGLLSVPQAGATGVHRSTSMSGNGRAAPPAPLSARGLEFRSPPSPYREASLSAVPENMTANGQGGLRTVGASRAKSMGHAQRPRPGTSPLSPNTPGDGGLSRSPSNGDNFKPVFLKGLFSVNTTSTKSPQVIRADLIRVLDRFDVKYREIKGGFNCYHSPSIDLSSVQDTNGGRSRRRLSNGHNRGGSSMMFGSESDDEEARGPGGELVLHFEVYVVKVPLLGLYGVQFKKVAGDFLHYKSMAAKILGELKL
ncbi:Serine/threonine-protein kinase [Saitoella coloradoensis]